MGNLGCMFKLPWKRDIRVDRNYSFRFFVVFKEKEKEKKSLLLFLLSL